MVIALKSNACTLEMVNTEAAESEVLVYCFNVYELKRNVRKKLLLS